MRSSDISFYIDQDAPGFRTTTGLLPTPELEISACALTVGDTVSFPHHRNRVYRVVSRHCNAGADMDEPQWLVRLEPVTRATD
ncbi:MAG: hypothetical protein Q4G71_17935 [Pseudomonadota bacterium]|nr:hypothetical protein [Pseudomonadota bacterium]